jgi:hypothetical protein
LILLPSSSGRPIALSQAEERLVPIAKITGQGLAAIAVSVGLLWTCLVAERMTMNRAVVRRAQLMRELRQLQQRNRTVPASTPLPGHRRPQVKIG